MSVSPGAQTLHGLSANHKPGFSASAALQSGAAETERDRGHWGRHTQVTCQRQGGPGLSLQRLWLWNIRILVILMVLEGCYVLEHGALFRKNTMELSAMTWTRAARQRTVTGMCQDYNAATGSFPLWFTERFPPKISNRMTLPFTSEAVKPKPWSRAQKGQG